MNHWITAARAASPLRPSDIAVSIAAVSRALTQAHPPRGVIPRIAIDSPPGDSAEHKKQRPQEGYDVDDQLHDIPILENALWALRD